MAKAMASGSATIPTISPAVRSAKSWARVYVLRVVTSLGTSTGYKIRKTARRGPGRPGLPGRKRLVKGGAQAEGDDGVAFSSAEHATSTLHVSHPAVPEIAGGGDREVAA